MVIRRVDRAEAALLRELVEQAYAVYVERIGRRPAPMDRDYEELVCHGDVFVADDGTVAGLIVLVRESDHVLVENLAVDPDRQGAGIGRALLAYAETYAQEHDLRELRLYTNEAMAENLAFYPRLGYGETGRRCEHGFRRVYFSKQLSAPPAR